MDRPDEGQGSWERSLARLLGTSVTVEPDREGGRDDGEEIGSAGLRVVRETGRAHLVAAVGRLRLEIRVPPDAIRSSTVDEAWVDRVALAVEAVRLGVRLASREAPLSEVALSTERVLGRDEAVARYSMSLEHAIDDYIRTHSEERLRRYLAAHPIRRDAARLADGDRLRGLKDLMISILAVSTRVAADAGTNVPVAFGISDYFIREFERSGDEDELERVLLRGLRALADSVATARHLGRSALVRACEEWILTHLDGTVRPSEAAAALGVRQDYLVDRFRRETGMRFAEYALASKVEEAKTILTHTDLPISEICRRLGFYDQSHLIRVFRRFAHDTPHRYRVRTRPR